MTDIHTSLQGKRYQPRFQMSQQTMAQKEPYAHLTTTRPFANVIPNAKRSVSTVNKVMQNQPVKDYDLANLDDNLKRGGSLLIATLATLGLNRRVFGIGEFLGFLSWFGAMAITPKIINGMVNLKTGVNLSQEYNTTYGQREQFFKDPHYLPFHIFPDATINRIADKLGIPKNDPERRKKTEDKMQQISVQTRTWWMLVAGPATPVISGLICDQLQDYAVGAYNKLKTIWHGYRAESLIDSDKKVKLTRQLSKALDQMIGEVPESGLSRWWKDMGKGIVKVTGLKSALSVGDVVNSRQEEVMQKMVAHFEQVGKEGKKEIIEATLDYLKHQNTLVDELEKEAGGLLAKFETKLEADVYRRQKQFLETRIMNARSTLTHYGDLMTALKNGSMSAGDIRKLLEKPVLAEVQKLTDQGLTKEAAKLVGKGGLYNEIRKLLDIRQYGKAFKLMGASPSAHLLVSLKDTMLRKLWQRRVLGYLGGGLLLATAAFTQFVVGKDFRKTPTAKPQRPGGTA